MRRAALLPGLLLPLLAGELAAAAPGRPGPAVRAPCDRPHARRLSPPDGPALARALAQARPGDLIALRDGVYAGRFEAAASGTADAPIVVCGPRRAILDAGSVARGYGLHVTGDHWVFAGFTVRRAKKGIVLDGASGNVLEALEVTEIGNEGVRFRAFSSDNVLRDSWIHRTGRVGSPHTGEGVYVGTFHGQWCERSACGPDRSDRNQILDNRIGPDTTAECIDVKEGTTGGVLRGNVLSGEGMVAPEGADSWIDVKGNGYTIERNRGTVSPGDGFQVHAPVDGWGRANRFHRNVAVVGGPGHAFRVPKAAGNVVGCDNEARGAGRGLANVPCE